MAQQELFGWLDPETPAPRAPSARTDVESQKSNRRPTSRADALAKPAPAVSVRKMRMAITPSRYADRRRTVNGEAVARLLEVTRGVIGIERAPKFTLPRSRFTAQVNLWKGRPVGTPFVMGN